MTLILPRAFAEDPAAFDGLSLERRDPNYIRDYAPLVEPLYRYYFRVAASGFELAPRNEPYLLVGNHNGGINSPDTGMTVHAWYVTRGADAPIYALIHPTIFKIPHLNVHIAKMGGVAALARMALKVLDKGFPLLVYPGAGDDAYKPFEDRHKVLFFGNDSFVRLALRLHVPVVPIVSLGAHESLVVIDNGRERARAWGLDKLGIERLPLTFSSPMGLSLGAPFNIPWPTKIRLRMGAPIRFSAAGRRPHQDADVVARCYAAVVHVMQGMLDTMVAERQSTGDG